MDVPKYICIWSKNRYWNCIFQSLFLTHWFLAHIMQWYIMQGLRKKCAVQTPVGTLVGPEWIQWAATIDTVQDFLIKLGIKPTMHLLEISIFLLNNDLVRFTKIMNHLVKDLKILSFKVIFPCLKLVNLSKKIFCEEYLIMRPTFMIEFFENFDF